MTIHHKRAVQSALIYVIYQEQKKAGGILKAYFCSFNIMQYYLFSPKYSFGTIVPREKNT